ncbi:uncharacterized protein LOC118431556 [Branchiostoma floridae]|uniref:Uncharacterized protein LOC118431556 n=1 Tax=Branchiostoma floridae TaxID=7739 RepID=C3YT58_BRAFL|nr:uncharacterized protein LOC118431556 [Branchiostoma floridae]|eukprot:XP_002600413.1 hypothetical protein BRAFLDRAFT_99604 [Branchiostoma floridae]
MDGTEEKPQPPRHKPLGIVLIVFAWLTYVMRLAIGWMAESKLVPGLQATITNGSRLFPNELSPSFWTFLGVWQTIYAWNFLWLIYVLTTICRRNSRGYFYVTPELFPTSFYVVWYVNHILLTCWRYLSASRSERVGAVMVLFLSACTLYYLLYVSYRRVDRSGAWLTENAPADLWLVRILAQNGLAIYATWSTIATLISFGSTLTYAGGYNNEDASTGMLGLLLAITLVWFVLENFVFERYCRYTLVQYVVVVVALSGILDRNQADFGRRNIVLTCVLLVVASLLLVARLSLVIWRHVTQPLYVSTVKTTSVKMSQLNAGFA